jgi:hypothetical protein
MKGVAYEAILIIGVLVAVGFSLFQLRGILYGQQLIGKEEVVYAFAKDLESVVDKAIATTGDAAFVYYPSIKQYSVVIKNNTVTVLDKVSNLSAYFSKYFTLVDNSFEDCEKIFVFKKEEKIFITCKCFELGEACSDSLQCCSGFCNMTSGKCEEMPVCPASRVCTGAPEAVKIGGKDCCPADKPVCDKQHCCPLDKPKWCEKPTDNNPRCMNESEYNTKCKLDTVLIVALKTNLKKVYSNAQINMLENKINEFINSLGRDGLNGIFLYLDEDETSDLIGNKVTKPDSWNNIDGILDQLIQKLNAKYLIIIGGYDRFIQAPIGSPEGSDDAYGDYTGDYLPDIAVGRIPDPNNGDLDVILNTLDTAISLHDSGGLILTPYIAPIMSCGGIDNRPWNSGRCFCSAIWGTSCSACSDCCGCIYPNSLSGKHFVMILAHGPGPSSSDAYRGGCLDVTPSFINSIDVSNAVWMTMSCGGGHLRLKASTSGSMGMTFLKSKGAIYVGSTDLNYGGRDGCPVPGGDSCIGSLYTEIVKRFSIGKRIGDAYKEGKNYYLTHYSCPAGTAYQAHINCLYGDPTLKIKSMW